MGVTSPRSGLADFAAAIGPVESGPVWVAGRGSRVPPPSGVRIVRAPSGILGVRAEEMVAECGAGTPIEELQAALAEVGQYANLPNDAGTVGGALAMAHSDLRRLGRGAVRDAVLRIRFVSHDGSVITAGGSTVKNVSGFDLCRLLVGSRGALGCLGDVLLRTRPLPPVSRWFSLSAPSIDDVHHVLSVVYRPAAALWNGRSLLICLEGHGRDIDDSVSAMRRCVGDVVVDAPVPEMNRYPFRWSVSPSTVADVVAADIGGCWAEMGVGTVHHHRPPPESPADDVVTAIEARLRAAFDPTGRLNPTQGAASIH